MIFLISLYVFYCTENRHYYNNMPAMQISKMYTISPYAHHYRLYQDPEITFANNDNEFIILRKGI